ncbi:MAG: LPS-assembly protein LptD [Campylobacterales bacterium]|nr:LPS-assembly protein LptD [Campylobacterales bacterium]
MTVARRRWWWMRKRLPLLFFLLYGSSVHAQQIEMFASRVDANETHTTAHDDVIVVYDGNYLSAKEATYDRSLKVLELHGAITAMRGSDYMALGEYARIEIDQESRLFSPFYFADKSSRVWMSTARAEGLKEDLHLEEGMVSGCDPADPLWKIRFSSLDYDIDTKWIDIYNARLYMYDIPVFYFPYFGYTLDTRRRSGVLTPAFGYASSEGVFYQQPVYFAWHDQWDVELRPQVRTLRGEGIYGVARFVDSPKSKGAFSVGYFQEHDAYVQRFDLANNTHYGFALDYENEALVQELLGYDLAGHQSGLWIDATWMNDVDFINLSSNDEIKNATSNQVDSRINFFYDSGAHYVGAYAKYFLDLNRQNNDETIQSMPIVHYHRYLDTLLRNHLYYALDASYNNFYRMIGKRAVQTDLVLPFGLQGALFDEYVNLEYGAKGHLRHLDLSGEASTVNPSIRYDSGNYAQWEQTVKIGTSLTKGFDTLVHTLNVDVSYSKPFEAHKEGYYEDYETLCGGVAGWSTEVCDYYTINEAQEQTQLGLTQYLFDREGGRLYHKLSQRFYYAWDMERAGLLESELEWDGGAGWLFYNDTFYSHERQKISKIVNTLRLERDPLWLSANWLFEDVIRSRQEIKNSYLTAEAQYKLSDRYRLGGKYAYDMQHAVKKNMEIGLHYSKRCWEFGVRYVENNRPILTSNESASVYDKYLYFTIALQPMGGSELGYKISNELEGS